jgi:hypothetical protein
MMDTSGIFLRVRFAIGYPSFRDKLVMLEFNGGRFARFRLSKTRVTPLGSTLLKEP